MILPLLAAALMLSGLGALSMDILSSVRAYVGAAGNYSAASKNAVFSLNRYANTHEEPDYQHFLNQIAVPLGNQKARLALDRAQPDLFAGRQGFLAAGSHEDDIDGMLRLFRQFRHISMFRDITEIAVAADSDIEALGAEARKLHANRTGGHDEGAQRAACVEHIRRIGAHLEPLSEIFASRLGDASRQIQRLLLLAMLAIAAILVTAGAIMSRLILTRKERSDSALRISEERLNLTLRGTSDGLWDWDMASASVYYSPRMKQLLEVESTQAVYDEKHFLQFVHPDDQATVRANLQQRLHENVFDDLDFRIIGRCGTQRWLRSSVQSTHDLNGKPVRMTGSLTDISGRKQAALELLDINRSLQMLSRCNEAVIRAGNEHELLRQICQLAVDIGGYRMAWVAYAEEQESGSGKPLVFDDLAQIHGLPSRLNHAVALAHAQAVPGAPERHGQHGGICLPLRDKNQVFGLLVLHSDASGAIAPRETKMLNELADDLAFGIASLRVQDEQRKIHAAVLKIAAGVSASTGTEFFQQLARNMAEALGADGGFVARLLAGEPMTVRTIAGVINGRVADSFDYILQGRAQEQANPIDRLFMPEKIIPHFIGPVALRMMMAADALAYVGRRLDNSAGEPIGLLFVLLKEPLLNSDFVTSTLQIFAARAAAEMERQSTDARIQAQASLLDKAQDAIIVRSIDQRIQYWNQGAQRLYGWSMEQALGRAGDELLSDHREAYLKATQSVLENGEWSGEMHMRRQDGSSVTVESRWTRVLGDDGGVQSILAIDTDITLRKAAEQEIVHLAFYDSLTMLPNRRLLMDRLQQALVSNARNRKAGALLIIDLDNFKTINDTLGHDTGDLLLQQVAARLVGSVRAIDTVARLGGDEFVVILLDLDDDDPTQAPRHAKAVGEKILVALDQPYQIAGMEHHSTSSIGITLFNHVPDSTGEKVAETSSELLKRADLAMYESKAAGRNTVRFFDPEMQAGISTRATLEASLRLALARNEFVLHYQPQVNGAKRMMGVEALLRWQHPLKGLLAPPEFIALAEDSGLILPIGLWVLETACAQLAAWSRHPSTAQLDIAVNISARQFRHPDFVAQVTGVIGRSGANPHLLKLELTESLLVKNMEATIAKMTALKKQGVGFSLDDFGTGYSSLIYLKRLPLDELKIDQSFIEDVLNDANDAAIANTIISLAHSLGLAVIAEGVETEAQHDFLLRHGCQAFQGHLFGRPMPMAQLTASMQRAGAVAAGQGQD